LDELKDFMQSLQDHTTEFLKNGSLNHQASETLELDIVSPEAISLLLVIQVPIERQDSPMIMQDGEAETALITSEPSDTIPEGNVVKLLSCADPHSDGHPTLRTGENRAVSRSPLFIR